MRKLGIFMGVLVAGATLAVVNASPTSALDCQYADADIGSDVRRCIHMTISPEDGYITVDGVARIADGSPTDHWVKVENIRLQRKNSNGTWSNTAQNSDSDGYWESAEEAAVGGAVCIRTEIWRAVAEFYWKRKGSSTVSHDTVATPQETLYC